MWLLSSRKISLSQRIDQNRKQNIQRKKQAKIEERKEERKRREKIENSKRGYNIRNGNIKLQGQKTKKIG